MTRSTFATLFFLTAAAPLSAADPPGDDSHEIRGQIATDIETTNEAVLLSEVVDADDQPQEVADGDSPDGESSDAEPSDGGLLFRIGKSLLFGDGGDDEPAAGDENELADPTHRQIGTIEPSIGGKRAQLYSFKTTPEGLIAAIVGVDGGEPVYEIQLLDHEGTVVRSGRLDGQPSGVAIAPDGQIYVGGSGKIWMLDDDLSVARSTDSPHIGGDLEAYRSKLEDSIRAQVAGSAEVYKTQLQTMQSAIEKLEAKEEPSRIDKARLKMYRQQAEVFEELIAEADAPAEIDDQQLDWALQAGLAVTSMAASGDYVFVCANESEGYGKSVYRMSRDLDPESVTVVMAGKSGCCGQFDIQCGEDGLICSENTNFKVALYDFDGKRQDSFGRRDRSSRAGFGSCCNPMNSLPMVDGTILTAESSIGHIKRFDTAGNLVAYIGKAKIGGGCKHCAMGYDAKRDLYYMMAEDDAAICVLASISSNPMTEEELRAEAYEAAVLERLAGTWKPHEAKSVMAIPFGSEMQVEASMLSFDDQTTDITFADPEDSYYGTSYNLGEPSDSGEVDAALTIQLASGREEASDMAFAFVGPNTADITIDGETRRYIRTRDAKGEACASDGCGPAGCKTGAGCVTAGGCGDDKDRPASVVTDGRVAAAN